MVATLEDRRANFRRAAERVCRTFYSKEAVTERQALLIDMLTAYERMTGINEKRIPWARMRVVDGEAILLDRLECE